MCEKNKVKKWGRKALLAPTLLFSFGVSSVFADLPTEPVFENGIAQPVFADEGFIIEEVLIETSVDTDKNGVNDVIHAEIWRKESTEYGLKVPVVLAVSPYYGVTFDNIFAYQDSLYMSNEPLYIPGMPVTLLRGCNPDNLNTFCSFDFPPDVPGDPDIPSMLRYLTDRGYAIAYVASVGTPDSYATIGNSTGCPTAGDYQEGQALADVVEWFAGNGVAHDGEGNLVHATWSNGNVGTYGTSYDATVPLNAATTGVDALKAVVSLAPASNWYQYYRTQGAIRMPTFDMPGQGSWVGEDAIGQWLFIVNLLEEGAFDRCAAIAEYLENGVDRQTGEYNAFWDERNLVPKAHNIKAATMLVHGLQDSNVPRIMSTSMYEELKKGDAPHQIYFHRYGHLSPEHQIGYAYLDHVNKWYTRYLWEEENGVEGDPKLHVERNSGDVIAYPDFPDPAAQYKKVQLIGDPLHGIGQLNLKGVKGIAKPKKKGKQPKYEWLLDDWKVPFFDLAAAKKSLNRIVYQSSKLKRDVRMSGTAKMNLKMAFNKPAANLSAAIVEYKLDGSIYQVARGHMDPQNRKSIHYSLPVKPYHFYQLTFDLQPTDHIFEKGSKIGIVIYSSDSEATLFPPAGTKLILDTKASFVKLPIVQ